jgi:hypothetical protein
MRKQQAVTPKQYLAIRNDVVSLLEQTRRTSARTVNAVMTMDFLAFIFPPEPPFATASLVVGNLPEIDCLGVAASNRIGLCRHLQTTPF